MYQLIPIYLHSLEFKKTYQSRLSASDLNAELRQFVQKKYIENFKLTNEYFVILTKTNSIRGFGLNVVGLIDHSDNENWVQLRVTFRNDFKFFNMIFGLGLMIRLIVESNKMPPDMLFDQRMVYLFIGILLLAVVDIVFLLIPWLSIKKGLVKALQLQPVTIKTAYSF